MKLNHEQFSKLTECRCIIDTPSALDPFARLSSSIDTQWTKLAPETVVVATANSAWLYNYDSRKSLDRFARSMSGIEGSISSTQNLLDGAIAAAYYHYCEPQVPELTLAGWIWQLAGHYHLTSLTSTLMEDVGEEFSQDNQRKLSQWAKQQAQREREYNLSTLRDIEYLGYDAKSIISQLHPHQPEIIINYLIENLKTNPLCYLGYSYTLEHMATRVEQDYRQQVQSLLPPNIASPRRPWFYGSVGVERENVEETTRLIDSLSGRKRSLIAKTCYEVALLCFEHSETVNISNAQIEPMLQPI
ncbi:MAG: hypothetical protein AAF652_19180 [Cyanobacteria bacterium P01_C01_bin.72]